MTARASKAEEAAKELGSAVDSLRKTITTLSNDLQTTKDGIDKQLELSSGKNSNIKTRSFERQNQFGIANKSKRLYSILDNSLLICRKAR